MSIRRVKLMMALAGMMACGSNNDSGCRVDLGSPDVNIADLRSDPEGQATDQGPGDAGLYGDAGL